MELSKEQQHVYDTYKQGQNVFITGPGGSGKTEIIRKIYNDALSVKKNVQVCALTGCAAILLKCRAKTIHSWSGIGLGNGTIDQLIFKIKSNSYKKNCWRDVEILIIDEVSMMSLKLFDTLDAIGRAIKGNYAKPFGGIQVIFSGDFYQLPPVGNLLDADTCRFCFESVDWTKTFSMDCQVQLLKIFRQTDELFASILNQIREGRIKRKTNDLLLSYVGRVKPDIITQLYPTKKRTDHINNLRMNELSGIPYIYVVKYNKDLVITCDEDRIKRKKFTAEQMDFELKYIHTNLNCETTLMLKLGAHVMCVVNMETSCGATLFNGSQGIVTGFTSVQSIPIVKFGSGPPIVMNYHVWNSESIPGIGVSQIPLILAWALTIHKSQGSTLESAEIDAGKGIFECGQTYVALSRVKSLEGLYLTSFDVSRITINKKVRDFYDILDDFEFIRENEAEFK